MHYAEKMKLKIACWNSKIERIENVVDVKMAQDLREMKQT